MFRLLIVEDEENSRKGLKATLAPIPNLEIDTACDGREGCLKAIRWNPDIIISDIHMPVWDGLVMTEKLCKKGFAGTIYLLTGYAEFEYARKALQYHVEDYILKPVVPSKLRNLIEVKLKDLNKKRNSQNPQLCHLLSDEDSVLLTERLAPFCYTDYFLAVVYMEREHHLPLEVKETVIEERGHYILTLPDKHYRGILIGFTNHMINHGKIDRISSLLEPYEHLTCIYETRQAGFISNWLLAFEQLRSAIPWTITCRSRFLSYDTYMEQEAGELNEDVFFKKDLQRMLCGDDFDGCRKILLKKIGQMQAHACHPSHILAAAVSGLVKFDSKQAYLEAVNQMAAARTMHEIRTCIDSYYETCKGRPASAGYSPLIQKALHVIDKSYKEPISLNSVAEQLNITPQYLSRLFMKEMSRSFVDYLTSYRMERAKNLLQDTNMKINMICVQVGYQDAKYFCTLFKKITGVTPNQYRASSPNM